MLSRQHDELLSTYGEKEFWPDITGGHRAYEGWEVHLLIALNAERYPPSFCRGFMEEEVVTLAVACLGS